jgi:hybrid cluster-associated redox disulfide protein
MSSGKITKDTALGEIVAKHPESARVMLSYGLHCVGCHVAGWETLEQGAKAHGLSDEQIGQMVSEINNLIAKKKEE